MAKSPNAFRTISEAAEVVGAPQHVLRFWETKFSFITPVKRAGGRRFYRPQDIVVLKAVRRLLHDEGLTIKGVQRLHKDQGLARLAAYGGADASFSLDAAPTFVGERTVAEPSGEPAGLNLRLKAILTDLDLARARLEAVLAR